MSDSDYRFLDFKVVSNSAATSISATFDNAPPENSVIFIIHHTGAVASIAPTEATFTADLVLSNTVDNDQSVIYSRKAGAAEGKTFSCSSSATDEHMMIMFYVPGDWAASYVNATGAGTRTTTASYAIPGATSTQDNELAIAWMQMRTADPDATWSNGYLEIGKTNTTYKALNVAAKRLHTAGSTSTTATMDVSNTCLGGQVTFKRSAANRVAPQTEAGVWSEITSTLDSIDPENNAAYNSQYPAAAYYHGTNGQAAVIEDWNGGVIRQDASNCEYVIAAAGGHAGYAGNETYKLDLLATTPTWAMPKAPWDNATIPEGEADGLYAAGEPSARHTYNYSIYDQVNDKFTFYGGLSIYDTVAGGAVSLNVLDYDFTLNTWSEPVVTDVPSGIGGLIQAFDNGDGKAILIGNNFNWYVYDKATDSYTGYTNSITNTQPCGCYDSKRGIVVTLGNHVSNIELYRPGMSSDSTVIATTSPPTGMNGAGFSIVYDSVRDRYVGWSGGQALYDLDPDTYTWSTRTLPAQTVTPTSPTTFGTYDRWAYIEPRTEFPYGGYVIVNGTTESTYLFTSDVPPSSATILPLIMGYE